MDMDDLADRLQTRKHDELKMNKCFRFELKNARDIFLKTNIAKW